MTVHVNRVTALPVNDGPECCPECWALPGRDHGLSCPAVSPEQFLAFIRRDFQPHPAAVRNFRGPVVLAAVALAVFWLPLAALLIWSLR